MHDDKRDRFVDELLEASLKQYRGEEPRPGLEMRILAGIRSGERAARRRRLVWAVAGCAGTLAVVVLALRFASPRHRQPSSSASLLKPTVSGSADPRFWGPRFVPELKQKPRTPKPGVRATKRPEQFPSPMPLTEQEKLLLAYVEKATKPDSVARSNRVDEAPVSDLEIPGIKISALEIKPLDDSQSEQEK